MAYDDPAEYEFTLSLVKGLRAHPLVGGLCIMPHVNAVVFAAVREILLGEWN
jgi:hypothetical protein